ncbi:MAG: NAD(P)-dependent alcohol dehydrogenase [Myxococcota bacterium]
MNTQMKGITLAHGVPALADDLPKPRLGRGEVLVRVSHSAVNAHEFELASKPLIRASRWLAGYRGKVRTGLEFSGWVESAGAHWEPGTRVMGYIDITRGHNSHAQWLTIPRTQLAQIPPSVSLHEAAAIPMGAQTALVALRTVARAKRGDAVLVFGASGGVGLYAIQLARHWGVEVTAVARSEHHEGLLTLGASKVVDYREVGPAQMTGRYDAILELSDTLRLSDVRHLLADGGAFIPADPLAHWPEIVAYRAARWLLVDRGDSVLLEEIASLTSRGVVRPVVAAQFPLEQWRQAIEQSRSRSVLGRVLLNFAEDLPATADPPGPGATSRAPSGISAETRDRTR